MRSASGAVELGLFVDCGLAGLEPDSQSQPCLFCALSIPCTTQHGSTVNKGCSVSASRGSIIYAFNRLPNLLSPTLVSSRSLTRQVDARTVGTPPHIATTYSTQLHVDIKCIHTCFLNASPILKHVSLSSVYSASHVTNVVCGFSRQNTNEQNSAILWTDPDVSTGSEKHTFSDTCTDAETSPNHRA